MFETVCSCDTLAFFGVPVVLLLAAALGGCLDASERTACVTDDDCIGSRVCRSEVCEDPPPPCDFHEDCPHNHSCEQGQCEAFSVRTFVAAWTDTWCNASAVCCPALADPERLIACRANPLFDGLPDEPVRRMDDAIECLFRTTAIDCDRAEPKRWILMPGEDPCMRVIRDHARQVGESCDETTLCAHGICANGVCVARGEGESCCVELGAQTLCDGAVCEGDRWCDPSGLAVCTAAREAGDTCQVHQQCYSTLCDPASQSCVVPSFHSAYCPV